MNRNFSVSFHFNEDVYSSLVKVNVGDGEDLSFFVNLGHASQEHVFPFKGLQSHLGPILEMNYKLKADLAYEMVLCISETINKYLSTIETAKAN